MIFFHTQTLYRQTDTHPDKPYSAHIAQLITEKGNSIVEKIYERHQLLTEFFYLLGVERPVGQVDACKVEYDLSDETFESIKRYV